jgi:hypothetical protein
MIDLVREQVLLSPSVRTLVEHAVTDLLQGHCHLVLRPNSVDGEPFCRAVLEALERRHWQYDQLDAATIDANRLPNVLFEHLGIMRPSQRHDPLDALQGQLAVDVLQIEGLDALPPKSQHQWLELAVMWGRNCQRRCEAGQRFTVLFGVVSLSPTLLARIESDVRLKLAWWWGIPSSLEFHLLCRAAEDGRPPATEEAWREHQAASLASGDAEFLARIWPLLTEPLVHLCPSMLEYARQRGWSPECLRTWMRSAGDGWTKSGHLARNQAIASIEPPTALRELWSRGVVYYAREYGCELHAAAVAALGDSQQLTARLWRGQATLILPRLDAVRYQVCSRLTEIHGSGWPTRWDTPESSDERAAVDFSPYACQWGYLRHLLRVVPQLERVSYLLPLANAACNLRNDLAHCRPVEYTAFEQFVREAEQRLG